MGLDERVIGVLPGRAPGLLAGEVAARLGSVSPGEVVAALRRLERGRRVVRRRSRAARRLGGGDRFYRCGPVEGAEVGMLPEPLF